MPVPSDLSQPIRFQATTQAPGPADFIFDEIGFGPISGSLALTDDLLGIGIPLLDVGVTLDYTLGARLVLEVGFGTPNLAIDYQINDGTFVGQSSEIDFLPAVWQVVQNLPHYRNTAISFDTAGIDFLANAGAITVTPPAQGARAKLSFDYEYLLKVSNAFVGAGWPIDEFVTLPTNITLLDSESNPAKPSRFDIIDISPGQQLGSIDAGVITGFVNVPTPPDYAGITDYVTTAQAGTLPAISVTDSGPVFAELNFDISKLLQSFGVPIGAGFDLGLISANVSLLAANVFANAALGQRETFRPDDLHIQLELLDSNGVSTGKVIAGRLGDKLSFDSAAVNFGFVKATYTLYGALEQETGLELGAGLNLGLLTGSFKVDAFGLKANVGFGPLIPLPSPSFSTGLIPLVSDSKPLVFSPFERIYAIYSEKDAVGSDGNDDLAAAPSQIELDGKGGDDIIQGYDITANILRGSTGDDIIYGASLKWVEPPAVDAPNQIFGGTGDDQLFGGSGDDRLDGGSGSDLLQGAAGNDVLFTVGIDGIDTLDGGSGIDTAYIDRQGSLVGWQGAGGGLFFLSPLTGSAGVLPDGTIVNSIEQWQLFLGFGNDKVIGGNFDDILNGGAGNDELGGGLGADILRGEGGNDVLYWQQVAFTPGSKVDQISGGAGMDTAFIQTNAGAGHDVAFNLSGVAALLPTINGGIGVYNDATGAIDGLKLDPDSGPYNPVLIGNLADFATSITGGGFLLAPPNVQLKVRADVEKLVFTQTGSGNAYITGGFFEDNITGGAGDDRLDGLLGLDTIAGGAGDDMILNWDKDALLDGGSGFDTLAIVRGEAAAPLIVDFLGRNAANQGETSEGTKFINFERLTFDGSSGRDVVKGGTADDVLYGNGGDDELDGRGGGDFVDGGAGDDVIFAAEGLPFGTNHYRGGLGKDTLILDWQAGTLIGSGFDLVFIPTGLTLNLTASTNLFGGNGTPLDLGNGSTIAGFERVILTSGDGADVVSGGSHFVELPGLRGGPPRFSGDVISTGGGNDVITASGRYDVISAADGDDTVRLVYNGNGSHRLDGGNGTDTLIIDLGFNPAEGVLSKVKNYKYMAEGTARSVKVTEFTLPDGTVFTNFEKVVFEYETLGDVIAKTRLPGLDSEVSLAPGARVSGGKGNDIFKIMLPAPSPAPDPLGPIAALKGGLGDDLFQINSKAEIAGGLGLDVAELDFSHITAGLLLKFGGLAASLTTTDKALLSKTVGIEVHAITLGSGNDVGTIGLGQVTLDFGAGIDKALIDHSKGTEGKIYAFGFGGVAPLAASGEARIGESAPGFGDLAGMRISNFEELDLVAGAGEDFFDLSGAPETLQSVRVDGDAGNDVIVGSFLGDLLSGGAGDDQLMGGAGDDTLIGGDGADVLVGDAGADTFRFDRLFSLRDGPVIDTIIDFNSVEGDLIDLSRIDANTGRPGNQAFLFIGEAAFSGRAGELRHSSDGRVLSIEGDVNGDGIADLRIDLVGVASISAADFIL